MSGQPTPKKFQQWLVLRNGRVIEEVFYLSDMNAVDVKASLVNHDGFTPNIVVVRKGLPF